MRAISSSTDVHGVRYTQKRERLERIKRVNEVEEKQQLTKVGEYESRGITKEDKEKTTTTTTMTPQQAFRKEIAQLHNSPIYRKMQNKENNESKAEKEEQER